MFFVIEQVGSKVIPAMSVCYIVMQDSLSEFASVDSAE